ncbi:FAD:protein FMN transferase [Homoserinibacter sp. GY 40078]|nr:FAD:protein FMN transferase [Homoserinibacter sp. GY 40078]
MGTEASLSMDAADDELAARVAAVLARADARFSLYRDDSELSRIAHGELDLVDASVPMREAYERAITWRSLTGHAFTPHRPDGVLDLSGIVKATAMEDAADVLDDATGEWLLGVGGDLLWAAGMRPRLGVVDPTDRDRLLATIRPSAGRRALATSGSAERGDHIWRRHDVPAPVFTQATVAADDIVTADVLATAIIAGGEATLDSVTEWFDVDVLTVGCSGELRATPGMRAAVADARDVQAPGMLPPGSART